MMKGWGPILSLVGVFGFLSGCRLINPCFNVDCGEGEVCVNGDCRPGDACENDDDCDPNFVCDGGNCVTGECNEDDDCDGDDICNADNECVECEASGDCNDNNACTVDTCGLLTDACTHTGVPCTDVGDCPAGCNASCNNLGVCAN